MKKTTKKAVKVGAGVAAATAVAGAAGYYFFASKNAKENRKIAAKWAGDLKKKAVAEVKMLKKATPKAFSAIVDKAAKAYAHVDAAELKKAARELKANWKQVQAEFAPVKASVKKAAKKVAPKTAKKVAKKAK